MEEKVNTQRRTVISDNNAALLIDVNALSEVALKELLEAFKAKKVGILKPSSKKPSLEEAIEVLCNALREDKSEGSYYYSWQANIAMCMYDSFDGSEIDLIGDKNLLDICNKGAKTFLNLLIKQ